MKLSLTNVRRFDAATFDLSESTLYVGPNGAGKTTVLEAIHYLSVGRSHRATRDRELIGWGEDETVSLDGRAAHLTLDLSPELTVMRSLAVQGTTTQRKASRNGVPLPLLQSIGLFHVVLFAPESLELITGPPKGRRRYLDILLASTSSTYALALAEYQAALRQRNQLIVSQSTDLGAFDAWEALLVARGRIILEARQSVVTFLAELLPVHYQAVAASQNNRSISLAYVATVTDPDRYADLLAARRSSDARFGATSIGPHRDDLVLTADGRPVAEGTSRGEQRTLLLALKRAELQYFDAQESEVPPILLLDDMFSELDERRSQALADLIADRHCLITTTDATAVPTSITKQVAVVEMDLQPVS